MFLHLYEPQMVQFAPVAACGRRVSRLYQTSEGSAVTCPRCVKKWEEIKAARVRVIEEAAATFRGAR